MNRLAAAVVLLTLTACPHAPPPTQRALECNELCAQYIAQGDLERAEVQCDLGLQFSPQYADLWVNKGIIALNRGQDAKGKECFIKALRYNADQAQAYNNLGFVYFKDHQYGKAHDNFQNALRINPDYLEARLNLALTLKEMNQPDKAKKEFRTLVEINPNVADPHAKLGELLYEEGSVEEALQELTKAVQLDPRFVDAWLLLGNVLMEGGKPCDAKDAFSACLEVDGNNAPCRSNIMVAERTCQLQDKALSDVKEHHAGTKTPQAEFDNAVDFKQKGQVNDEERSYKRCLKVDPKYPLCHYGLFELYRNRSDQRLATIACKNFLKFASEVEFQQQVDACKKYVKD
jgi:Tfp pilus assembly protein PilF